MTTMTEYRAYVTIPDLPFADEDRWERVIHALERDRGELGPVIGWNDRAAEIVLATDADDEAAAGQIAYNAVVAGLHAAGLGRHYPSQVEVELVAGRVPATA